MKASAASYRRRPEVKVLRGKYAAAWKALNPEAAKAASRRHEANRTGRDYHLTEARRTWYLLKTYGITEADYQKMLASQGGVCALCGKLPSKTKRLSVDHDHNLKRDFGAIVIRGLIHSRCNTAIGSSEWSDDVIRRWIIYLQNILDTRARYLLDYTPQPEKRKKKEA